MLSKQWNEVILFACEMDLGANIIQETFLNFYKCGYKSDGSPLRSARGMTRLGALRGCPPLEGVGGNAVPPRGRLPPSSVAGLPDFLYLYARQRTILPPKAG